MDKGEFVLRNFKVMNNYSLGSRTIKLRKRKAVHVRNTIDRRNIQTYRSTDNQQIRKQIYEMMLRRYHAMVINEVNNVKVYGYDFEDLMQEAYLVIFEIINKDYKMESKNPFWYFLRLCIRRQLYSLIAQSKNTKNNSLNMSYRFEEMRTDSDGMIMNNYNIMPKVESHENMIITKILVTHIMKQLVSNLSEIEFKSFFEKTINNLTYKQINQKYGFGLKGIDNAIWRVKRKLRYIINQNGLSQEIAV